VNKAHPVLLAERRRQRAGAYLGLQPGCTGWHSAEGLLHGSQFCPVHDGKDED